VKYPKQTFLLLIFTLLERFVYYVFAGKTNNIQLRVIYNMILGILFSYLSKVIKYSPETLELILQMFHVVANSFPILGAIVADCWVGKYGTIVFFTLIYICGLLIISITGIASFGSSLMVPGYVAILLIALGSGSIRACLLAFGGDQFTLPQQRKQIHIYFHLFYFFGLIGIFGRYLTIKRILKLRCYGYNTCWSLSFGITTLLVATVFSKGQFEGYIFYTGLISVMFIVGKRYFIITKPETNIFVHWTNCVGVKTLSSSK
jgi:solute carrier family 15 oligopeptide transporter 1